MNRFCSRGAALARMAGLCGLMAGCAAEPGQSPLGRVPPAPSSDWGAFRNSAMPALSALWISEQYTDLPIPKDFRFEADESFVFVQGTQRRADLNYEGTLTAREVIQFYQETMPTHGWQFLRMSGVRMKTLTYVKGDEMVEIIVESHGPHHEPTDQHEHEQERQSITHLHIQLS